jgi:NAD(P)-dependent dehydrogenase (short-subunit alcohol dehydrogenase family)
LGLTKTAALEFATKGVRVNGVSPGPIQTEMFDRTFGEGEADVKKTIATQTPACRIGTPQEIASANALAQFTRCGVHHRPGHYFGWQIHRTIAGK